jgi:uncharacterized membrane protein
MKSMLVTLIVAVVAVAVPRLFAQEHPAAQGSAAQEGARHEAPSHDAGAGEGAAHEGASHEGASREGAAHEGGAHDAGPVVPKSPQRRRWPAVLVFVILILFLMAVVIGPIVRAQAPPEMPATHSHDEPPGASHHHGHGGTISPVPEDVAHLEDPHGPGAGHHL